MICLTGRYLARPRSGGRKNARRVLIYKHECQGNGERCEEVCLDSLKAKVGKFNKCKWHQSPSFIVA